MQDKLLECSPQNDPSFAPESLYLARSNFNSVVATFYPECESCDVISRRLMAAPGIGPITALAFATVVDEPARFKRSKSVGVYTGMTPRRYACGVSGARIIALMS